MYPPDLAWIIFSVGVTVFLGFFGYSLTNVDSYQFELAEYKVQVGSALSEVKKVSDTLEQSAETSTIAPQQKRKIQQQIEESNAVLEAVEAEIFDEEIEE